MEISAARSTVGILVFDNVEVLDFCGPFEVLSVAAHPDQDRDGVLFRAVTIAKSADIVTCIGGLRVEPHHTFQNHPRLDILIVPGGQGTRRARLDRECIDWIKEQDAETGLTTSVCTGAFLLAEAGLAGGPATTHWSAINWMRDQYPDVEIVANARVVDRGHIITSAGISAGIDMALHIVERLHGRETAQWTARRMEYDWHPEGVIPRAG